MPIDNMKIFLDRSLASDLEYYSYKGYCAGTYNSHYLNGEYTHIEKPVLILFKRECLEVVIYPYCGCKSLMGTVPSFCNCVAGEDVEDVEIDLVEKDTLIEIVEDYENSEYTDNKEQDIYGDFNQVCKGKHYKFIETEGFNPYVEVHRLDS